MEQGVTMNEKDIMKNASLFFKHEGYEKTADYINEHVKGFHQTNLFMESGEYWQAGEGYEYARLPAKEYSVGSTNLKNYTDSDNAEMQLVPPAVENGSGPTFGTVDPDYVSQPGQQNPDYTV